MKKYKIAIEEIVVDEFELFADSVEDAMRIAEENYANGNFVLCPGLVQYKQMAVVKPLEEITEFTRF